MEVIQLKLKEEYKNIDLEKIILDKSNKTFENNIPTKWLNDFKNAMEKVRKNNWYDTFVVLYELVLKVNEDEQQLQIKGQADGILDNIYITYQLLVIDNQNIKLKISSDLNVDVNTIVLTVSEEYEKALTEYLNNICEEWEGIFQINEVEPINYK